MLAFTEDAILLQGCKPCEAKSAQLDKETARVSFQILTRQIRWPSPLSHNERGRTVFERYLANER